MKRPVLCKRKNDKKEYQHLAKAKGCDDNFVARLLFNRGIVTVKDAEKFLNGGLKDLHDPRQIKNIMQVSYLLLDVLDANDKVYIFGDYDVDGITATAIMYLTLKDIGFDVDYRLPDRLTEGYGMSVKAVEELHQKGCQVIITVDNGIKCHEEIALAKKLGMRVIVLDHHKPADTLPDADVIIDLHLEGEEYPFKELAGCGIAFKVSQLLYDEFGLGETEYLKHLDLVAIGTIADVVPLVDENRILVKEGLKAIRAVEYDHVGLYELMNQFEVERKTLCSSDVSFKIAPALNAPGRLNEHGSVEALSLLLCSEQAKAASIATSLIATNDRRKDITKESLDKAEEYIAKYDLLKDKVLVLYLKNVPEGVVGLVSGKITEKYYRPSLVFSEGKGNNYFKASARSIPCFDLYKALCTCDDLFIKYGGHPMAAGMTIPPDLCVLDALRTRINEYAETVLTEQDITPKIFIDCSFEEKEITMELIEKVNLLEPFGQENKKPIFFIEKYYTTLKKVQSDYQHYMYMGKDEDHLKLFGQNTEAVGFGKVKLYEELGRPQKMELAFTLSLNHFRGSTSLQLEIVEFCNLKEQLQQDVFPLANEVQAALTAALSR